MVQHVDRFEDSDLEQDIEACRAALGGSLDVDVSESVLEPLRQHVEADLSRERGLVARLRALRTSLRVALVLAATVTVTLVSVLLTPRVDLAAYPLGRMWVSLLLLSSVTAVACWRLLRPLHAPPPAVWASRALLVTGVLLPCLLAVLPIDHVGVAPGEGAAFAVGCGKCLAFGAVLGLPVLVLAFLVRRAQVDGSAIAALAGVAASLTGNLTLQLHCPITDPAHLLGGHAFLIVPLGIAAAMWRR